MATDSPLSSVDRWDDFMERRYRPEKPAEEFRSYNDAPEPVRRFYRLNHENQTVEFNRQKRAEYLPPHREKQPMWEALERLNDLVDDSDPDTDFPQIVHALQTAEKIRSDGHPDWMALVGLVHDAGKMLCFYGEPQWAVVGDTYPVGCAWSEKIIYPEFFANNPDTAVPEYQTSNGIYEEGCGIGQLLLSWGHDEYIYQVLRDSRLPAEGLAMLRYHSFYPWHREGAYRHFMDEQDHKLLPWVREFNKYDLYSKSGAVPDVAGLTPDYKRLIEKYLPAQIQW